MNHETSAPRKPLRLWPGIVAAVLLVLIRFVIPAVAPDVLIFGMEGQLLGIAGGMALALAIFVWWALFSRARWPERVGAIALMIVGMIATRSLIDASIENGMNGMMLVIYGIPPLALALVAWAAATRNLSDGVRRAAMVATILLACGAWTLVRTNGILGGAADLAWRWTPTAEERLLARSADDRLDAAPPSSIPAAGVPTSPSKPDAADAVAAPPAPVREPAAIAEGPPDSTAPEKAATAGVAEVRPAEWPGFRGPRRDGVIQNVRIDTNWKQSPPIEIWRRAVGPGWSSFAVSGDLLYTQEQRGDDEIVACYRMSTGEPVWRHRDPVRFWESNGGAGPRATPTLSHGRVYTFGATGIVNALDGATGRVAWSRNAAADTGRRVPDWGFASSPLIVDNVVIVAAAGTLIGYDAATGNQRWIGPSYGGSYSSPHRATIDGVVQVVLLGGPGAIGVAPADGAVLWTHTWSPGPIVQPAVTEDGDILINAIAATGGLGTRRLHLTHASGGWRVEERWTSSGLKPYFNDFVIHGGYAFGFDGNILACIDLADGTRRWKGGRFGNGQLVLLADQGLLLVLSEEGELALVSATADKFTEVGRFAVLNAKTWNHPVIVGDVLLVRNGEEMAAFRLPPAPPVTTTAAR
jgi:outer membrane protein assembly factor BamB